MEIIETVGALQGFLNKERARGKSVGLVPTMGALHAGHFSLVKRCKKENSVSVASIFVNPTQFDNQRDLERYPRTLVADMYRLEGMGCRCVFVPSEREVYPVPDGRVFDFGLLDKGMEGRHRPGHFNGVAQVVSRLLSVVQPERAYFGEKDFQQLAIVTELVRQLRLPVEVVRCPTVREASGLAMSSRNAHLTPAQRRAAPRIARALFAAADGVCGATLEALKKRVVDEVNASPQLRVEYFDVVHVSTLQPVASLDEPGPKQACIAVWAGDVRLIDSVRLA